MRKNRSSFFQLFSTCAGNLFEHYDTALFGFLSTFLAPVIFPSKDPTTALLLTYVMIPIGMLARPVGALFFGYLGDSFGRNIALFWSLLGMGIISFFIGVFPAQISIGFLPPLFICLARMMQNFCAAGETIGGAIYLLESSSKDQHDFLSGVYGASTIGGIIMASIATSLLVYFDVVMQGWRYLYFVGVVTAVFGLLIRKDKMKNSSIKLPSRLNLKQHIQVLLSYKKTLAIIALVSGFSYVTYSISIIFLNGCIPLISSISSSSMITLSSFLLILDFILLPLFGLLSSKFSRIKLMVFSSIITVLVAVPSFFFLQGATAGTVVVIRIILMSLGAMFSAPLHAFVQGLVPKEHRYSVISFGYSLGSQLLGGPSAAISLWLFKKTGQIYLAGLYWVLLAFICSVVLIRLYRSEKKISFAHAV